MHITSGFSHFRSKITRKELIFSLIGSLTIWLSWLPQSLSANPDGKRIYQQNCVACHTIGGGRLIGPDLKGVTSKRDPSWLVRWIKEPNKMLAEGDPIATQQLKEYNNIPMPNFGLSDAQAKNILAYIEEVEKAGGEQAEPIVPIVVLVTPVVQAKISGDAANGKISYQQKCAVCHKIGSKGEVGPDLKGVTSKRDRSWLVRWIKEPNKVLDEGDSVATQLLQEHNKVRMPNLGISETETKDILAYIMAESGEEPYTEPPKTTSMVTEQTIAKPATVPVGNHAIGKALFIGQKAFTNGGPACIACHTTSDVSGLGGGTLGPDLTKAHSRFGGDMGLKSVLVSLPFPTMQGVFSKKPVLDNEATHLNAYFAKINGLAEKGSMDFTISVISIGGLILLYILAHLIWRKRLLGVRIPLVGR